MNALPFTKMHGLGNDFMVLDLTQHHVDLSSERIQGWANRHTGIGFDQLLTVSASHLDNVDFEYRIYNADGSEVEQCGNGARCFARFVLDQGLTTKNPITVATSSGIIRLHVNADGNVTVDMGAPDFTPSALPLLPPSDVLEKHAQECDPYPFPLSNGNVADLYAVSVGNPHGVMRVDNVATAPVQALGPELESHPWFPQRANIGFLQIVDSTCAHLRVYERGSGETQACGTGACAAAVVAFTQGWLTSPATLHLPGGALQIEWNGKGQSIFMTGPAATVYQGQIPLTLEN